MIVLKYKLLPAMFPMDFQSMSIKLSPALYLMRFPLPEILQHFL